MKNITYALRNLLKSPGYTALAVGALALGIGANTVLFSAINTLFLRPLALPEPEQLVRVYSSFPERGLERTNMSWPRYSAFRDQQDRFTAIAAQSFTGFTLTGRGDPLQVLSARVTRDFFTVLGVQPVIGRGFTAQDDSPGAENVAVLNQNFWRERFNADPAIVGQALVLDGRPYTVIGVMPVLPFPFDQNLWAAKVFEQEGIPADLRDRGTGYLNVIGRLKPGVTPTLANEQLRVIHARFAAANAGLVDASAGHSVIPLQEDIVGQQRPMFFMLLAAVGCVLLIACANVGNLLLARFAARRKEIAIRTALGATRGRIVTQFLTESVLTAGAAGALGILFAVWGVDVLVRVGGEFIPRSGELRLDGRVLGFAVSLSVVTGILLGLVPALQASRTDASESLKDSARGSTGGRRAGNFRAALLVAEVALSLVLLVAAALLVDSFRRLQKVDPGFRSDDITTFNIGLPPGQYPTPARHAQFYEQLLEKLRALPGVTHASASNGLPIVGGGTRSPAAVDGEALPPMEHRAIVRRGTSLPGFFAALDIPLRRGRDFTWRDTEGAPNVVIINEVLAKRLFGDRDPVGRRLITGIQGIPREVVGVTAAFRSETLADNPPEEMFYPAAQIDGAFQTIVVRSIREAGTLRPEIVNAVRAVDPGMPVGDIESFTSQLGDAVAARRLAMMMLGGFAGLALVLAGMGIYSVIAYSVAQRTNEFGIRMALGAEPGVVVRMVMKEGLRLAGIGLAVGLFLAVGLTRLIKQQLYEVSATDPLILGGVAVFLCVIAALACFVPARRATRVDPLTALRAE